MPFDNSALVPLVTNGGFSIWYYRTTDARATALGAGYFLAAAAQLVPGDVLILQAADALTLTTVRAGTAVPAGLVVDTAAVPFRATRSAAQRFSVRQAATAVAMTLLLAPLAGGIVDGGPVPARAEVIGPITEVAFSIRDASGATVRGPLAAPVTAGLASTMLAAPPPGTGYRLRVEAVGYPEIVDTSPAFIASQPFTLLDEADFALLLQDGGRLLLA